MQYPLDVRFKIIALAPQLSVRDAQGNEICYVRQKLFKLKEKISVFVDSQKKDLLCEIHADRVIDFSAAYRFLNGENCFGSVKRRGMRSLWRTHYEISDAAGHKYTITEGNPWTKVMDGLFGSIPILGAFGGYFFHPRYEVKDLEGKICYTLRKRPAFLEARFQVEETVPCDDDIVVLMALMMVALLERNRG